MSENDRDKLISAIYSMSLSPVNYDETIEQLDGLLFEGANSVSDIGFVPPIEGLSSVVLNPIVDPEILIHCRNANNIQLRVGREKAEIDRVRLLLDAAPNPAYVFDEKENILALNDHANSLADTKPAKLKQCCENTEVLRMIRSFVKRLDKQKLLVVPGFINDTCDTNTCILVKRLEEAPHGENRGIGNSGGDKYFLSVVNLGFDHSKTELFRTTYDLTPAEVAIAVQLASGKRISQIATEREATVTTIRTQVKMIKKKTGSIDIPAIVRLLCGFSAGLLISSQLSSSDDNGVQSSGMKSLHKLKLRDGRQLSYMEQGDPNGRPVLMIHNMPYGVELPKAAIVAAQNMNLRILAPYRPGHGASDPIDKVNGNSFLDDFAVDVCELLDHLSIPQVVIVGHTIGTIYGMRFTKLFPNRVKQFISVSYAPVWRDDWMANLPSRQRFNVRITKYFPQLLPVIIRSTIMLLDKGHGKRLVHTLCKDSPFDIAALNNNPEICDLMVKGCEEGLIQGGTAFCRDCLLTIQDFLEEARSLVHPIHILHGDVDGIIDISRSIAFAKDVPETKLEVVKGGGHLLVYSHWDRIFKVIKNFKSVKKQRRIPTNGYDERTAAE